MSVAQNQTLLYSDLTSFYTSFNNFITSYGGSITKLTVPAQSTVKDTDINNLNGKINEFKSDTYLKTQASWWVNASVTRGNLVKATDVSGIQTTITNMAKVKCRNTATNNKSTNANCKCSNSTNANCCNTNSTNANCQCSNSTNSNCCNTNSTNSNCCNTNSTNANCQCINNTSRRWSYMAWYWVAPSKMYGAERRWNSAGWWDLYDWSPHLLSECTQNWGSSPDEGWWKNSQGTWEHYYIQYCSVNICINGNHGQNCQRGNHGQNCQRGNHGQTCSRGNHGQNCQRGNHGQTCSNANHGQTCSNTTVIDITCQQATKGNN